MKIQRLRGRKVNDYLRRNGTVWRGKTMTIRWMSKAPRNIESDTRMEGVFVGTAASSKLQKSAPKRNRMRRRCREAIRTFVQRNDALPTVQMLVSPRISSLTCDYKEIQEDVEQFFATL